MKNSRATALLDKLGAVGAILAAAAAPCCFPLLAAVGAALGLSVFESYAGYIGYVIQGFVVISAVGAVFAFGHHRQPWPFAVGLGSTAVVFFAYHVSYHVALIYGGLAGLAVAAVWNVVAKRTAASCCRPIQLHSTITCPHCGHQKQETMPADACMFFYECESCHATLRPKPRDCCVFCSYGSVRCPPNRSRPVASPA